MFVTFIGSEPKSLQFQVAAAAAGEPDRRLPAEEICELEVVRIPPNPKLVMACYETGGSKQIVRVWVGINKNFVPRMRLRAQRGATENQPWKLVGRRPRRRGWW
jgi:hypothetical protein